MGNWAKDRNYILRAGFAITDARTLYHPGGWPQLGLSPVGGELSRRSTSLLARQLEWADREAGRATIISGLERLDPLFASELASVYLSLVQRFPGVYVGGMNFCAAKELGGDSVAVALEASRYYPTLFEVAVRKNLSSVEECLAALAEEGKWWSEALGMEVRYLQRTRRGYDPRSHGSIELGPWAGQVQNYGIFATVGAVRNYQASRCSNIPHYIDTVISEGSATVVHEFGHLVEEAVTAGGVEVEEHVFGALESILLYKRNGHPRIDDATLRRARLRRDDTHLINYPRSFVKFGPGTKRARVQRTVGQVVRMQVNNYATKNRDEMFAEAFFCAIAGTSAQRAQFSGLRQALYDVGVAVKRRRV